MWISCSDHWLRSTDMSTNIKNRSGAPLSCSVFYIISWSGLPSCWWCSFILVLLLQLYFWPMTSLNQDQVRTDVNTEFWIRILRVNVQSPFFFFFYLGEKSVLDCVWCPVSDIFLGQLCCLKEAWTWSEALFEVYKPTGGWISFFLWCLAETRELVVW